MIYQHNMTSTENYEQLKATVESVQNDFEKFRDKHVKISASRARHALLDAKKLCDILRKQILEECKALPVHHHESPESPKPELKIEVQDEDNVVVEPVEIASPKKAKRKPKRVSK